MSVLFVLGIYTGVAIVSYWCGRVDRKEVRRRRDAQPRAIVARLDGGMVTIRGKVVEVPAVQVTVGEDGRVMAEPWERRR